MKKKKQKVITKKKKQLKPVKGKSVKKVLNKKVLKPAKPIRKAILKTRKEIKGKPKLKRIQRRKEKILKSDLKRFLKDQGITEKEFNKQSRKIQKEYEQEFKETRPSQDPSGAWYYPNTKALKEDFKGAKVASYRHSTLESAVKWWEGVTGGAGYFVILRKRSKKTGKELFFVMDIDPDRRRKGTSKKVTDYQSDRALKLEEKFRESEDI